MLTPMSHSVLKAMLDTSQRWLRPKPLPLGVRGERAAAKLLRKKGYIIVAGGVRKPYGEIDLIAVQNRERVVFVEVKTRRNDRAGDPALAVDSEKQARIAKTALGFLKANDLLESPLRFDIVAILWPVDASKPTRVVHHEAAFEPPGQGQFYG